ncbi:MAG: hypothetical protein CMO44_10735 [Verrucomicrobiales bacterium]|nr:hypothetical protein [Verrucomicrobiales bacterium]
MATVKPFPALMPDPNRASEICELPYDVMSTVEARQMADGRPLSFLHVSRPEIDLPQDIEITDSSVYAKARQNLDHLISEKALRRDVQANYYLYRQIMGSHSQLGLVAVASCAEYDDNTIRKHEFTRPDKENDRVSHLEALDAQTGPVFLTYSADKELDNLFNRVTEGNPNVDFTATDGVQHTSWTVTSSEDTSFIDKKFSGIQNLYIADGHHRSAAASRVNQSRSGAGNSGLFLTVIFPHDQMQILPYNRVVRDLNGLSLEEIHNSLGKVFEIELNGRSEPLNKHEIGLYINGQWKTLRPKSSIIDSSDPIKQLDVSILQDHILAPIFGIEDPRVSKRIAFVGGIRGVRELEKQVDSKEFECAFSLFPTSIKDLMSIADGGGIMPPKSTWFEPKLRDGMFSHQIL